jgi:hypothetical protein
MQGGNPTALVHSVIEALLVSFTQIPSLLERSALWWWELDGDVSYGCVNAVRAAQVVNVTHHWQWPQHCNPSSEQEGGRWGWSALDVSTQSSCRGGGGVWLVQPGPVCLPDSRSVCGGGGCGWSAPPAFPNPGLWGGGGDVLWSRGPHTTTPAGYLNPYSALSEFLFLTHLHIHKSSEIF